MNYFFPLTSPARLAVVRIVFVFAQLVFFHKPLTQQLSMLSAPGFADTMDVVRGLTAVFSEPALRTPGFLTSLWWVTAVAGLLALIGLLTRPALAVFAIGSGLQVAMLYSYAEHHHPEALFILTLGVLACSPCHRAFSVDALIAQRRGGDPAAWGPASRDRLYTWPLLTVQALLAIAYFDSCGSKLLTGGLHWMNGYTLQTYLLEDGIRWDRPVGVWLAHYRWMGILMAMSAIAFEGSFWLVLVPRLRRYAIPLYAAAGLSMHTTIYIAQYANFFPFMLLYLVFLPIERVFPAGASPPAASAQTS